MKLIVRLEEKVVNLGLTKDFGIFVEALREYSHDEYVGEIVDICETEFFYVDFVKSNNHNKYDVGEIIVGFDSESIYQGVLYQIHLTYVDYNGQLLPNLLIEKNEFIKGFVYTGGKVI